MNNVYLLGDDPVAKPLSRLRCKDEARELQSLLLHNPGFLPSLQIDPEDPPQWLLIKNEMAVPGPATGQPNWLIDFLYVDHTATVTLVECKRYDDPRSRREVVAQMIEYAANGQHYWSAGHLQQTAENTAGGAEKLAEWVVIQQGWESVEKFFEAASINLPESRMRLIFFLEESPNELRSLVEFLNRQLKDTEVLLVEARLYESTAGRIVVPWLFGYTEEARVAKSESKAEVGKLRADGGEPAFWEVVANGDLAVEAKSAIRHLVDSFPGKSGDNFNWSWRVGAIFMIPTLMNTRGLFGIERDGSLRMFFGNWHEAKDPNVNLEQQRVRLQFTEGIREILGVEFNAHELQNWPSVRPEKWVNSVDKLVEFIGRLMAELKQRELTKTEPLPSEGSLA